MATAPADAAGPLTDRFGLRAGLPVDTAIDLLLLMHQPARCCLG